MARTHTCTKKMKQKATFSVKYPTPLWFRKIVRTATWVTALYALFITFFDLQDLGVTVQLENRILKFMASFTGFVSAIARFIGVKPVSFHSNNNSMEEVTGYWVEIPEGATEMTEVNGSPVGMSFSEYAEQTNGIYTPETSTQFGTFEWGDGELITSAVIGTVNPQVHELIGGAHAPTRPK